ncbi:MAG: endopeptidase La [Firmicutes bacterium]|nr:endopeptidase La [Bacillota bacterium]
MTEVQNTTEVEETVLYPLLPLRGMMVFPYMITPLDVGRDRSIRALEEAMTQERQLVLAAQKSAELTEPEAEDIYSVGVIAEIKQLLKMPEGQIRVLVEGLHRVEIEEFVEDESCFQVRVSSMVEPEEFGPEMEALTRMVKNQFEEYVKLSRKVPSEIAVAINSIDEAARLADTIAAQLIIPVEEKQYLLESISPRQRLEHMVVLLTKEIEILQLEKKIQGRVRRQLEKNQKEYYLREQMRAIQKELGEKDAIASEVEEFRKKLDKAKLPKAAREQALHELDRLEKMPPMAAEAVVVRTYLDWLVSLPWSKQTRDRLDMAAAEQILDEDHYGLDKVKERILEFLAVRHLTTKMKGPILCLVGPPGVGKTSLARSIARAMGRNFVRFSLGGIRDEAEIRGHRRTYIGAMPGKVIQAMKQAGSRNPVMLLDEIDKMTMDFRGDPASALLEVLDPEQNSAFGDHYLEVTFDLSNVFFITTANVMHNMPRPLLDRMEIIQIPGYTEEEKLEIAKRHLWDKQLVANGLKDDQIAVSDNAIQKVIAEYTRESGVRNLERELGSVCRKVARELVSGAEPPIRVNVNSIETYLGPPRYLRTMSEGESRVGVATGLAYTQVGGDILAIEVSVMPGKGKLIITGQLGDVMRESAQASLSYVRARALELGIPIDFYEKHDIHIHVPEGGIPKDGPSAGITIATALASALTGRPVRGDLAMTGEITLRGRVLPIGGVKEKVLAAHRAGIKRVLLPKENEKDLEDIPANIQRKLDIETVEHMDEVLEEALLAPVSCLGVTEENGDDVAPEAIPFLATGFQPKGQSWVGETHEPQ